MAGDHEPYRVLGVRPGASPEEITRAFRRLARTRHPDVAGPGAEPEYRRIRDAYERLTGPDRESADDPFGPGVRIPVRVHGSPPRRGADVTARVCVDLAELVAGTTRTVATGAHETTVRVPPGLAPGTRLRVPGHGEPGRHDGPPGDLVLTVEAAEHPAFRLHGRDLHIDLVIGYHQAVLGADIPVDVPGAGPVPVHVPPGTTPGTALRVTARGLPATGRYPAGDLVAEVRLHIPADLTPQARRAVAALAELIPPPRQGDR